MNFFKYILLLLPLLTSLPVYSKFYIVTTTPSIKWLVDSIGGDKVESYSFLKGHEDIHYIDAIPSFIAKARRADALCFIGKELEIGWLPKILERSGNQAVQVGGKGYCNVGSGVTAIEVPTGPVDRSLGDVHPDGNPHYVTGPKAFTQAAQVVAKTLIALDPSSAPYYQTQLSKTLNEIKTAAKEVALMLKDLKKPVMEYHKSFSYFFHEFGLVNGGALEVIPGVPPSAGQLAKISLKAKSSHVQVILAPEYAPVAKLQKFEEISHIPFRVISAEMKLSGVLSTYKGFLKNIADAILLK